ncbi:MAG TPA: hypothetical protein VEG34_10775 [Thermoanaerobaculia bacterium]|nr:hypothetical protein [Thermoanaerobaculia bacterium]
MVLALQYQLGPTNKQLLELGIRPRSGRKKKSAAPPAPGNGPVPQALEQADGLTQEAQAPPEVS